MYSIRLQAVSSKKFIFPSELSKKGSMWIILWHVSMNESKGTKTVWNSTIQAHTMIKVFSQNMQLSGQTIWQNFYASEKPQLQARSFLTCTFIFTSPEAIACRKLPGKLKTPRECIFVQHMCMRLAPDYCWDKGARHAVERRANLNNRHEPKHIV